MEAPPRKQAKVEQRPSQLVVATGNIRRKFRKAIPLLNSKAKYDYHIGVML